MTINQYEICPCGSGKRIKFCKCKDSLHEMERIIKMLNGEQMVAAIDRMNSVLEKHPNAAWCLALKGQALLMLGEDDLLAKNAERFLRLQPSNPLALAQQGIVEMQKENLPSATRLILQAFTESSDVNEFVLEAASILAIAHLQGSNLLTARGYLSLVLSRREIDPRSRAYAVLSMLNRANEVSLYVKSAPNVTPDIPPRDQAIAERYKEARDLEVANQILLAESKYESLARSNPNEACIWQGLLTCAVWTGNWQRQMEALLKLSEIETSSDQVRAKALVTAIALSATRDAVDSSERCNLHCTPMYAFTVEVNNAELIEQELLANPLTETIDNVPPNPLPGFDVPVRAAFELLDSELNGDNDNPDPTAFPQSLGWCFLYGKQTDRNACLVVRTVVPRHSDAVQQFIKALPDLIGEVSREEIPTSILQAISSTLPVKIESLWPIEAGELAHKAAYHGFCDTMLAMPLYILDGKTLGETKDDPAYDIKRQAILLYLDSVDLLWGFEDLIAQMRTLLKVPEQTKIQSFDGDQLTKTCPADLMRFDVASANNELLVNCAFLASEFGYTRLIYSICKRAVDHRDAHHAGFVLWAYQQLAICAMTGAETFEHLNAGKHWAIENDLDYSDILIAIARLALSSSKMELVDQTHDEIVALGRSNPEVLGKYSDMLAQMRSNAGGESGPADQGDRASVAQGVEQNPSQSGGIWTPESVQGASGGAGQAKGGSKLFIPGRD